MKILRYIRLSMAILGFLPNQRLFRFKWSQAIVTLLVFVILIGFELSSALYVLRHLQIENIADCLYAGIQITGVLPALGTLFTIFVNKRDKVQRLIDNFQKVSDKCNEICWNYYNCTNFLWLENKFDEFNSHRCRNTDGHSFHKSGYILWNVLQIHDRGKCCILQHLFPSFCGIRGDFLFHPRRIRWFQTFIYATQAEVSADVEI